MDNERITSAGIKTGEQRQEAGLRPQYLADYIGQQSAKENLKIFIDAARLRGEPLDLRNYYKIKPRICCDKFLECQTYDGLPEMKVFCFAGKAKFICYNLCKDGKTYTNMYDENWQYLDIRKGYAHFEDKSAPENSEEIIRVAESLAKPFEFVRVDLYNVDGKILFSELTFFTGGGLVPFDPPEYDEKFARFFDELDGVKR